MRDHDTKYGYGCKILCVIFDTEEWTIRRNKLIIIECANTNCFFFLFFFILAWNQCYMDCISIWWHHVHSAHTVYCVEHHWEIELYRTFKNQTIKYEKKLQKRRTSSYTSVWYIWLCHLAFMYKKKCVFVV